MAIDVGTAVAYLDLNMTAFNSGLQQAQSALQTFQNSASSLGQNLMSAGGLLTNIGGSLTRNLTMPLVNAGKEIVDFGSTFDRSMSNVTSVMQPTKDEFEDLRQAAIDWGGKTVYTADEAAKALYYMGLAGWETSESMNALGGVLNLAAAGQLELGQTSDIVTDAMTALHLSADGVSESMNSADWFVNLLAATMSNSNTTVDKLGESFRYVASAVGGIESPMYSAEEAARDTAFALGILANNGIKSSQAGTTLRRVILNLEKPTETVKAGLEGLNLSLEDVDMTTNGVKGVIDKFRGSVRNLLPYLDEQQIANLAVSDSLSEEEAQMQLYNQSMELVKSGIIDTTQQQVLMSIAQVSGAYAVAGLTALIMTEQDSYDDLYDTLLKSNELFVKHEGEIYTLQEAYDKWGDAIYDTSGDFEILGAAEGMAEIQMDNLQGSWIRFTSALDTTKIILNDIVKDYLKSFVDRLKEIVDWFNALDRAQQEQVIKWGLIVAAIGPALALFGNFLRTLGLIIEGFKVFSPLVTVVTTVIGQLHAETSILHGVLGLLKGGIEAIFSPMNIWIAVIAAVVAAVVDLWRSNEEFRDNVTRIWNTIVDLVQYVWGIIQPILSKVFELFSEIYKSLEPIIEVLAHVLPPILESISNVLKAVFSLLEPFINFIVDVAIVAFKSLSPVLEAIAKPLKVILDFLTVIFQVVSGIIQFITQLAGGLISKILESALSELKEFVENTVKWFSDIVDWIMNLPPIKWLKDNLGGAIAEVGSIFSGLINGSHEGGLDFVPFDGYVAELHKGERVLTADENRQYSNGGGNGTTINFYSNERIDEYTAARELRRVTKDIELGLV